ncbi:Hypothetical predicted protein [Octopus vulgaris]|uniref:Uncharacterized protein n=1 Tax=Octopus vulgaris TaxID=6645 RepID=A0AA36EY15_OCTVU|nr:Hypothetical predicted protein [Octopus vulgaris]
MHTTDVTVLNIKYEEFTRLRFERCCAINSIDIHAHNLMFHMTLAQYFNRNVNNVNTALLTKEKRPIER